MKTFAQVTQEMKAEEKATAEKEKREAVDIHVPCSKIQYQNAGALIRQKFEPVVDLIADYESGGNPDKWQNNKTMGGLVWLV